MAPEDLHLSLLIPDLLPPQLAEQAALAVDFKPLAQALSRAERKRQGRAGLEATLFELFAVPLVAHRDLPVAAVGYLADAERIPKGYCLRADPVHLIPDRDQLVLLDSHALALEAHETEQLLAELNTVFAEDGWRFDAPRPERWYLHLPGSPKLRTHPLAAVRGRAVRGYLPVGPDGKHWHRVMNEVQMLLHASPVNQAREAAGRPTVSSLWFWGGGELPAVPTGHWRQLWSNEPVSRGLASLADVMHEPLPADAEQWLAGVTLPGDHLLVLDDLSAALQQGGLEAWQQVLIELQRDWLLPLLTALRDRRFASLLIHDCDGQQFSLTRGDLKRWWRRSLPLERFVAPE